MITKNFREGQSRGQYLLNNLIYRHKCISICILAKWIKKLMITFILWMWKWFWSENYYYWIFKWLKRRTMWSSPYLRKVVLRADHNRRLSWWRGHVHVLIHRILVHSTQGRESNQQTNQWTKADICTEWNTALRKGMKCSLFFFKQHSEIWNVYVK